jgi:hypothetical protein
MYDLCVTGKPYFHQLSHSSCFTYYRVGLSGIRTNIRFSIDLENLNLSEYSKTLFSLSEF